VSGFKCKSGVSGKMTTKLPGNSNTLVDLLLVYVSAHFITNENGDLLPRFGCCAVRN
jgi:hypothetical protein